MGQFFCDCDFVTGLLFMYAVYEMNGLSVGKKVSMMIKLLCIFFVMIY